MRPLTIIAIVLIVAVPVYTFFDLNGGSFDVSDRQALLVVTDSMDGDVHEYAIDSFPANTLLMIQHVPDNEKNYLKVGDVISYFDDSGVLIHHRVVANYPDMDLLVVHGDYSRSTERVSYEEVNGKVVGTNHILGLIVSLLANNFVAFLAIVFVICAILIIHAVRTPEKSEEEVG